MQATVTYTIDVETDWGGRLPAGNENIRGIREALPRVADVLESHRVTATLFVSGEVARPMAPLLHDLVARGHEIASHGYTHRGLSQLPGPALREDMVRSRKELEDICGRRVRGFRAPQFRLNPEHFDALHETGFAYDSSVLVAPGTRLGRPYQIGELVEIPIVRLPWLRLQPGLLWIRLIGLTAYRAVMHRARFRSHVLYLHPFDLVTANPSRAFSPLVNLWYCRNKKSLYDQLSAIVSWNRDRGREALRAGDLWSRYLRSETSPS